MGFRKALRIAINDLGFDLVRINRVPKRTLLGLSHLDIRTIIDVGANQGQFARMIAGLFPGAEIYCFEPLSEPFHKLSAWATSQGGRVQCYQLALANYEGEAEMHLHEDHTPSSSFLAATDTCRQLFPKTEAVSTISIQVSTLDQVYQDFLSQSQREILLKLDVQGFEDRVLRGGKFVLSQARAVLLEVCLDPLYEGQATFHELSELLHESGLRYAGNVTQKYGADGRVIYLDAVFVR